MSEDDTVGEEYDVIFVCCKSYDLQSACDTLQPFVQKHKHALILPVLNGLSHLDTLDKRFGPQRVIGGVSHVATTMLSDGTIQQITPVHRITFGTRKGNVDSSRPVQQVLSKLKQAFEKTIVEVRLVSDIQQELWEKFVLLSTLASSTCLARAAVGDIMSTDEGEKIVLQMLDECIAAATFAGHKPRLEMQNDVYKRLTERNSVLTASMMRDLESGRPTEARHIVYDMLQRSRASGNPATYLSVAWMVLQARDARLDRERKQQQTTPKL
jgi:2-dehydropantoate 2-reductase